MKKLIALLLAAAMMMAVVVSCNDKSKKKSPQSNTENTASEDTDGREEMHGTKYADGFNYEDYETLSESYNRNLFYCNELNFKVADPTVIYVSPEQDPVYGGYFYAFGTSDQLFGNGIQGWRSTDMANWEDLGPIYNPDYEHGWGFVNLWAPEIIYDEVGMEIDGETYNYFMFYNADKFDTTIERKSGTESYAGTTFYGADKYMGVVYGKTPVGPFYSPDNYTNLNNELLTQGVPPYDFQHLGAEGYRTANCIDASPFIDSNGDRYLYYSGYGTEFVDGTAVEGASVDGRQCVYGVKMKDWFSPDYDTLTMICQYGKQRVGDGGTTIEEGDGVNEGPFMYKEGDTYMLTFSTFGFTNANYQVRLALSDNPLSNFVKVQPNQGGTVIKTLSHFNVRSAGHHCFVKVGDQLFIAYHTFKNRSSIDGGRALAIDEVFIKEYDGKKIFVTNGPTYSYQPLPSALSGYANVAGEAEITGDIVANAQALTDGLVKYQSNIGYNVLETELTKNGSLTLTFDNYKNVRAIMVYLPYNYWSRFTKISSVEITYKGTKKDQTVTIEDWKYDVSRHFITDAGKVKPGGSAILEFADLPVKQIKMNFASPSNAKSTKLEIDEIVVLSSLADATIKGVSDKQLKQEYVYTNAVVPETFNYPQGEIIGCTNVDGYMLNSTYGVDVSQDNGDTRLIKLAMPRDQYAYFKDVSTASAYVEAEFNVFASKAYLDDKYPKFGIVARNSQANTFFYIDATNANGSDSVYTNKRVGFTESQLGGGGWDWAGTENIAKADDITYFGDEGWTKLAILRLGNNFYFYCNDRLIFTSSSLRNLGTNDNAGYGFLCFNTGMRVRNYTCVTNVSEIENKLAELGDTIDGVEYVTSDDHVGIGDSSVSASVPTSALVLGKPFTVDVDAAGVDKRFFTVDVQ